jgi:DNA ligase-1
MKPMLLPSEAPDLDALQYPVYVTPKLDGIRCLIDQGVALSRTLKPIPNKHIQAWAKKNADNLQGADGELIVGSPTSSTVYRDTNSFVMSHDKVGDFTFFLLDYWDEPDTAFEYRQEAVDIVEENFALVWSAIAANPSDVLQIESEFLEQGYEGVVLRNPDGKYKYGRCTLKENNAFKLKRFEDAEAVIVGFEEEMHNENEAETNELGRTKRSTARAGLIGKGTLGSFICRTSDNIDFNIGSGFDQQDRINFWENKESLVGKLVKYKHFPIGVKDKPRHPIFLGFRDKIDL